MNDKIKIVNYSPKWENSHYNFATKHFGDKRKRRNSDYIYWKFRGNPNEELCSLKLAINNNEVIGQLGLIPARLNLNNQIIDVQWACDLMVSKDFRGKGVAKLLYKNAHQQKKITLGSNPSPPAEISMLRSGYKKLKSSNKQFIPIYLGVPLKMKGINLKVLNNVKNPFLNFYKQEKYNKQFNKIDIIDANHIELFNRNKENQIAIHIDQEFKEWRFNKFKDYYPGVNLFTLENSKTCFSGYYNGTIYFITDLFLENRRDFYFVINFILKIIPKKIDRIRFLNNLDEEILGTKSTTIKYRTETSVIYYTEFNQLQKEISNKYFYYTHQDSDENI